MFLSASTSTSSSVLTLAIGVDFFFLSYVDIVSWCHGHAGHDVPFVDEIRLMSGQEIQIQQLLCEGEVGWGEEM